MIKTMNNAAPSLLVLGGCRSGKSRFAEQWATGRFQRKTMIATLEIGSDPEMAARVALHRQSRAADWRVVEAPIRLQEAIAAGLPESEVILVDCLTLWLTNMLIREWTTRAIEDSVLALAGMAGSVRVPLIMVANEVGLGIVPDSALGRRFRDLAGWTNQKLAAVCGAVVFMAAGIPMTIKGSLGKDLFKN